MTWAAIIALALLVIVAPLLAEIRDERRDRQWWARFNQWLDDGCKGPMP